MSMKKGMLSIIIPAYNPDEQRLRGILDTLAQQSAGYDVEIIVVDDGSDRRLNYVKEYPNVVLKRFNKNRGVSAARNAGLALVNGEYIGWIDSDDEIIGDYIGIVFGNMREGYDWVSYDWTCDGHKGWAFQNVGELWINCAVWGYSFRADIIGDERFDEAMPTGSDLCWLKKVLKPEHRHMHDGRIYYNYRWAGNDDSLCHRRMRGEIK